MTNSEPPKGNFKIEPSRTWRKFGMLAAVFFSLISIFAVIGVAKELVMNNTTQLPWWSTSIILIVFPTLAVAAFSLRSIYVSIGKEEIVVRKFFWRTIEVRLDDIIEVQRDWSGSAFRLVDGRRITSFLPQESQPLNNSGNQTENISEWINRVIARL